MNSRKQAKSILKYIEDESGYTGASKRIKKTVLDQLRITIEAHGEVNQRHIDTFVRVFRHLKNKESEIMKYDGPAMEKALAGQTMTQGPSQQSTYFRR